MKFDYALEKALTVAKARNIKAVKALLDLENLKLADDKILGLDEQLKKSKKKMISCLNQRIIRNCQSLLVLVEMIQRHLQEL
ncbi:MAG: hypothetical protein GX080_04430 [Tissierellia bacterium]|nr:hypothetical protein [Tissierellia bacterium]